MLDSFSLALNLFFNFTILYWFCHIINMNLPQVYTCSPSWTLLSPPSLYHPSGSSQCTSPKYPVSCIKPGLFHSPLSVSFPSNAQNSSGQASTVRIPDTWADSWEICMQVEKQQLELDIEQQAGSKLGKEYLKAVYCHPAYLTYMQSI